MMFALRHELAGLMGGDADRTTFTKNGTEALNLAIFSLVPDGGTVIHGPLEHNAVMRPLTHLAQTRGVRLIEAPGDAHGRIDPIALDRLAAEAKPDVVATLHASNVHGLLQDIGAIGEICRRRAITFVVDAAQSAGCAPLDQAAMCIDALCLTGHKALFGPTGTGALLLSAPAAERIQPRIHGGTGSQSEKELMPDFLPDRLEAGTPNTFGLAGLQAGVQYVTGRTVADIVAHERELRMRLRERLRGIPGVRVLGDDEGPATAAVGFTCALAPSDLAFLLDQRYGIAVRAGLHCAPRAHRTLGTLSTGAIRMSPGAFTPPGAVEEAADAIAEILRSTT
jgi:selenocysteine lyase/cysteine desulfurase